MHPSTRDYGKCKKKIILDYLRKIHKLSFEIFPVLLKYNIFECYKNFVIKLNFIKINVISKCIAIEFN